VVKYIVDTFAHFVLISANLSNYAKMVHKEGLFEMICLAFSVWSGFTSVLKWLVKVTSTPTRLWVTDFQDRQCRPLRVLFIVPSLFLFLSVWYGRHTLCQVLIFGSDGVTWQSVWL